MKVIELFGVSKAFDIPGARPRTVRESLLGALRKTPRESLKVLDDLTIAVEANQTLGIMGRNGTGKSTLLKVMAGIYPPDQGRVAMHAEVTPLLELGVGWHPELDAVDNILLVGTVMGLSLVQAKAAVDEILAFAELERFANLELKHYSSGMASRLGYAVAFRVAREVILIDEIFAVGDAGFRAKCMAHFKKLRSEGRTMVIVSHAPDFVETLCDRAVLLDGGKLVLDGAGSEVAQRYLALNEASSLAPGMQDI